LLAEIPVKLLKEFKKDACVIMKYPSLVGISVPDRMLRPELIDRLKGTDFEVLLVPKKKRR